MAFNPETDLRPASFNGIPFWVESAGIESGHRVSTTQIPGGAHINESFGPIERKFSVDAYTVGNNLFAADALVLASELAHVGVLILPDQQPALVRLTKASRQFSKDKLGYVVVSLEAVSEPGGLPGISSFGFDQRIYSAVSAAVPLFGAAASAFVSDAPEAREAAAEAAASVVADLAAIATINRLPPESQAKVDYSLSVALASIQTLQSLPQDFGEAVASAAIVLADESAPETLAESLRILGAPGMPSDSFGGTYSDRSIMSVSNAGLRFAGTLRALALGEAHARAEWADRPAALEARALAAAVFEDALSRLGRDGLDLHRALSSLGNIVTERATARAASLAPLVTVSSTISRPSLVWSWRLYGTPDRAGEIVARSGAAHPGFLPVKFEALAS